MSNESLGLITEKFCKPNSFEYCGHGICNSEGTFCTCKPGYIHDYTQYMFPNCYLSQNALTGFLVFLNIFCFLIMLASCYVIRGTSGMPKLICALVIVTMILEMSHLIALGIEGKPGIASEIILMFLNTVGGCNLPFTFMWALCSPAMELMMLRTQLNIARRRFTIFAIFFFLINIAIYTTALVCQRQGDYVRFNRILSYFFLFFSAHGIFLFVLIWRYSKLLFRQMDAFIIIPPSSDSKNNNNSTSNRASKISLHGDRPASSTHGGKRASQTGHDHHGPHLVGSSNRNDKIVRHRRKLGKAVSRILPLLVSSTVFCLMFAVSYFGYTVHPYRFVLFFLFMLAYPFLSIVLLGFVYHKQIYSSSNEDASSRDNNHNKKGPAEGHTGGESTGDHPPQSVPIYFSSAHSEPGSSQQVPVSAIVVPAAPEFNN